MSYIGRQPTVGNFQICDAISVVNGQATYTMQVGSVNVLPETANHMIVSLNGVIQKPNSSFTVSGSTITFSSNLATGDVINFIQILGDVLDLGVPSDSTVSLAKLTATGTKNSTTFLRGDNTFNVPPLGGITGADQFRLSADFAGEATPISSNLERVDNSTFAKIGNGMSLSSGVFTFPETGLWLVEIIALTERTSSNDNSMKILIDTTTNNYTDGGTFVAASITSGATEPSTNMGTGRTFYNVTNTSNNKVRFSTSGMGGNTTKGDSGINETYFTFIRLGASQ